MSLRIEIQNPEACHPVPEDDDLSNWARSCWTQASNALAVVRIVGEQEGQQLNQQFRQRNYATNVLSFPYEPFPDEMIAEAESTEHYLGDLVICQPVVERQAQEQNKYLIQHWAHMLVHGLLHLQGFDHVDDADADKMEAREIAILQQLGFPNPYEPLQE